MWPEYISVFLHLFVSVTFAVKPLLKRDDGGAPVQAVTWFCVQRVEAGAKWRNFHSRGYPKALYVKDSRCTWRLQAAKGQRVQIAFKGLDLHADDPAHCASDYVEIIDETIGVSQAKFCGKNTPGDIVSQGRKLRIDFQAQPGRSNMAGFMISFKATTKKPGFYAKKSFETPVTQRPKKTSKKKNTHTNNLNNNNYNDGNTNSQSSSMSTVHIVGLVIGLLIALAIVIFIVRHMHKKRRKKKKMNKESASNQVTKFTDLDPNLPHNEVDPFERIDMACGPAPSAPDLPPPPYEHRHETFRPPPYPPTTDHHFKPTELPESRNFSWNQHKYNNIKRRSTHEKHGPENTIPIYSNEIENAVDVPRQNRHRPGRTISCTQPPMPHRNGLLKSRDRDSNGDNRPPPLRAYPKTLSHKVSQQRDTQDLVHKSGTQSLSHLRRLETRVTSRHPQRRTDEHHSNRNGTGAVSSHHESTTRVENGRLPSRMTNPSRF